MNIWIVKMEENMITDEGNPRIQRAGLLAEELAGRNHKILYWAEDFNHFKKKYRSQSGLVKVTENEDVFFLHGNGYSKNVSVKRIFHQRQLMRHFGKESVGRSIPDIIVASMPNIELALASVRYAKKYNIPVVIDIRDLWPDSMADCFPYFMRPFVWAGTAYLRRNLKWTLKNATGIVATSAPFLQFGLRYAERPERKTDKVFYVSYKKPSTSLEDESSNFWAHQGVNKDKFICCFFGEFGNSVDIRTVIQAAKILKKEAPDVLFVMCGNGQYLEALKRETVSIKNMIFPGWVEKDAIGALSCMAAISLLPYRQVKNFKMAFTNKFSEALAFSLPVLISTDGVMSSMLEKNKCGFLYRTGEELAGQIKRLVQDKNLLDTMSGNAKSLFEKSFSSDIVYKKYADFVEKIAAMNRGVEE